MTTIITTMFITFATMFTEMNSNTTTNSTTTNCGNTTCGARLDHGVL